MRFSTDGSQNSRAFTCMLPRLAECALWPSAGIECSNGNAPAHDPTVLRRCTEMILQLAPVHRQKALEAEKASIVAMAQKPKGPEMARRKKHVLVKALRAFSEDYILPTATDGGLHPLYHTKKLVSLCR